MTELAENETLPIIKMKNEDYRTLMLGYIFNSGDDAYLKGVQVGLTPGNNANIFLNMLIEDIEDGTLDLETPQTELLTNFTTHSDLNPMLTGTLFEEDFSKTTFFNWLLNLKDTAKDDKGFLTIIGRLYQIRAFAIGYDQTEYLKRHNVIEITLAAVVDAYRDKGLFNSTVLTSYSNFLNDLCETSGLGFEITSICDELRITSNRYEEWLNVLGGQDVIWKKLCELVIAEPCTTMTILETLWKHKPGVIEQYVFPVMVPGKLEKLFNTCVISSFVKYVASSAPTAYVHAALADVKIEGNVIAFGNSGRFKFIGTDYRTFNDLFSVEEWRYREINFISRVDKEIVHTFRHTQFDALIILPVCGSYDDFNPVSETTDSRPHRFYAFFKRVQ